MNKNKLVNPTPEQKAAFEAELHELLTKHKMQLIPFITIGVEVSEDVKEAVTEVVGSEEV